MPTKKAVAPKKATKTSSKTATKKTVTKKIATKKVAPKKAVTKKTVKSSANKKTVTKKSGRVLVCAEGQTCFWTTDGQILEDLVSLKNAFEEMEDEVFLHHVTKERNDFADWVESVLQDDACAAALRKSKKINAARTVVARHLQYYSV